MGILDELREEAGSGGGPPAASAPAMPDSEGRQSGALRAALDLVYLQLQRFVEELGKLALDVRVTYAVPGAGELRDLRQTAYALTPRERDRLAFTFSLQCAGGRPLAFTTDTRAKRDEWVKWLEARGLSYHIEDRAGWRFGFVVKALVPVTLRFEAVRGPAVLRVVMNNFERLGSTVYSIPPAAVTPVLVDELQRFILRRDNRFAALTGNRVEAATRQRFQEAIESRRQQRAAELGEAASEREMRHGLLKLRRLVRSARSRRQDAQGSAPDSTQSAAVTKGQPKLAPVLLGPSAEEQKSLDWNAVPDGVTHDPVQATPGRSRGAGRYGWMITGDSAAESKPGMVGNTGPVGAQPAFPVSRILAEGVRFRLRDAAGQVRFTGLVAGEYRGIEPLVDFGVFHGCLRIEYERAGRWTEVR